MDKPRSHPLRFGVFEYDPAVGELRKQGRKIKLQGQPIDILALLLEHPGEVVTREEVQRRLWPADTFVDFEHSLNAAVKRLRDALDDSADTPRYIETMARRGYRFIAPVDGLAPAAARSPVIRWIALGGVAALLLLTVPIALNVGGLRSKLLHPSASASTQPQIRSLAVLPLTNISGDPEQEYFADGMTEELITDLSKIKTLKVISRTSAMQYKAVKKPLPQIAKELGVDAVVEGSVQRVADHVRISAQLIRADTDTHLWAESYDRDLKDILALQNTVARDIANEIKVELTPQEQLRLTTARKVDPAAQAAYLKGRYFLNRFPDDDFVGCARFLEEATKIDPDYAEAHAALASCYGFMAWMQPPKEIFPKVKTAALKALEIDNGLSEGHQALGFAMLFFDWDWKGAEREFKQALDEDPSSAPAHQMYSLRLLFAGHLDEGIAEARKSVELDPASINMNRVLSGSYLYARRYDDAIVQGKATLELDPANLQVKRELAYAYALKGSKALALAEAQQVGLEHSPFFAEPKSRKEMIIFLEDLKTKSAKQYVDPVKIAWEYAQLGDKEEALKWLGKGYEIRSGSMVHLKTSPFVDPLRSDPRFQDLMRRMNFPP